jgi:hypothetical protein
MPCTNTAPIHVLNTNSGNWNPRDVPCGSIHPTTGNAVLCCACGGLTVVPEAAVARSDAATATLTNQGEQA